MDQQLATLITAFVSVLVGALVGGGAAIVIMDRIVKNILGSPVILRSLELLATSLPAPAKELIHDTGTLLEKATDDPSTQVNVNVGGAASSQS